VEDGPEIGDGGDLDGGEVGGVVGKLGGLCA